MQSEETGLVYYSQHRGERERFAKPNPDWRQNVLVLVVEHVGGEGETGQLWDREMLG